MSKKFKNLALTALSVMFVAGTVGCSQAADNSSPANSSHEESSVVEVTDETADQEIFDEKKPVFVDFYTTWCGPCKMLSPIIEELSEEYKDTVKFVKVNAEKSPKLAQRFEVMGYPTMKFLTKKCKDGKTLFGFKPKDKVKTFIDKSLKECK